MPTREGWKPTLYSLNQRRRMSRNCSPQVSSLIENEEQGRSPTWELGFLLSSLLTRRDRLKLHQEYYGKPIHLLREHPIFASGRG